MDTKQNDESIKKGNKIPICLMPYTQKLCLHPLHYYTGPCAPVSHTHEEKEVHVSVRHYGPESQNESQSVSKLPTLDAASAVPNEKKEIVRGKQIINQNNIQVKFKSKSTPHYLANIHSKSKLMQLVRILYCINIYNILYMHYIDQASVSSKIHKGKKLSTNEGIKKCSDTGNFSCYIY